jgi:hypothetical protein
VLANTGCSASGESARTPSTASLGARCQHVPTWIVKGISSSLDSGLSIRGARAVRSTAFKRVWLIAADLQGAGLEADNDFATWASNGLDTGNGLIYSADSTAEEFSDLGPLPGGSAVGLDGYGEAQNCVAAALSADG